MKSTILRYPKLLTLVLVFLITGGIGYWMWFGPLPDPSDAGIRDLARWLLQRDLVKEPRTIQLSLVNRLQTELKSDFDLPSQRRWSNNSHDQLLRNVVFLGKVWFHERCRQYQQLDKPQRLPFLESQLVVVSRWSALETKLLDRQQPTSRSPSSPSTVRLFQRIKSWIDAAEGEQRVQLKQTIQDATVCSLATDNMADQSMEVRRDLADRIASFLNDAGNGIGGRLELQAAHYKRLSENSLLLMEAWLINRAMEFESLSPEQEEPYLEDQLNQMKQWNLGSLLEPAAEGQSNTAPQSALAGSIKLLSRIVPHLETWISRAKPSQQEALRELTQQFQMQLIKNQFRKKP
jgi:hypothetical protein